MPARASARRAGDAIVTLPHRIAGVVLAGGRGRRFGGLNKALLSFGGTTLGAWCVARLAHQVFAVGINANRDLEAMDGFGATIVADGMGGDLGPLDGVVGAMRFAASAGCSHVVTIPVDTPLFPADMVSKLAAAAMHDRPICAASGGRRHGVAALWPVTLQNGLKTFISTGKSLKVMDFHAECGSVSIDFPFAGHDPFLNLNTAEDLAAAQRLIGGSENSP
jgi:molybdenum cofactor guanylyltransferase